LEHIIPEAIGGGLLLPKATCPCGPERTHGFEGKVTNQIFQGLRRQLRIRGKKRKRKPDELLLSVQEEFADPFSLATTRKVEIPDHPSMLLIPRIRPLPMLGTSQMFQVLDGHNIPIDIWKLVPDWNERVERLKKRTSKSVWQLSQVEIDPLLRLLAKIAHASAIATLGYAGFNNLILGIINGDMRGASELIGELPGESAGLLPSSHYLKGLHQIAVGSHEHGNVQYVLAHIRLFSNLFRGELPYFTPSYVIVVGTLN
jgi:hypothetical protein